jgi:hypothetical protein
MSASDRLYNLLPTHYRRNDEAEGQPLRALLAIMESQLDALEGNMLALYNNWFIETCEDWVVPYIADMLAVEGLSDVTSNITGQRSRVANTISYRRRKGITATLERAILEATNWYAHVVPYSGLLARTQSVKHVRPHQGLTLDIRDQQALQELGGPFESIAHSLDVRDIAGPADSPGYQAIRGRFNLPNAGVFIWRLHNYPVSYQRQLAPMFGPTGAELAEYSFDPFGIDTQLFNEPRSQADLIGPTEKDMLPIPLTRKLLADDLQAFNKKHNELLRLSRGSRRRSGARSAAAEEAQNSTYYGPDRGLYICKDGVGILPQAVASGNLDKSVDWSALAAGQGVAGDVSSGDGDQATPPALVEIQLVIDVELGRMAFRTPPTHSLEVHYNYGFSGDLGGGPYDRMGTLTTQPTDWHATVDSTHAGLYGPPGVYRTLQEALTAWNQAVAPKQPGERLTGLIEIVDSGVYVLPADRASLQLPDSGWLAIQASNGQCPAIIGDLLVCGHPARLGGTDRRHITLNGLHIDGQLALQDDLSLNLVHTTLAPRPGRNSIVWQSDINTETPFDLKVEISRSILGPLRLPSDAANLIIADSIVDSPLSLAQSAGQPVRQPAIAAADISDDADPVPYGPPAVISGTTIFGQVFVSAFRHVINSIFTEVIKAQREQVGSIDYSYVPLGSQTPRRLSCQPGLALEGVSEPAERALIARRIQPQFVSTGYGQAGYAQLSLDCPVEISRGGVDGAEMGAFNLLDPVKREGNLLAVLREYMNAGLEAGIFYVT